MIQYHHPVSPRNLAEEQMSSQTFIHCRHNGFQLDEAWLATQIRPFSRWEIGTFWSKTPEKLGKKSWMTFELGHLE